MTSVFFSYSHADEGLRDQLEKQLAVMRRQGTISAWHDRRIGAGEDLEKIIDQHLETDDIILLLVSPDFLSSDYCYEREMARALERHRSGTAIVIPVILRACDWKHSPFGKLLATPPDGKPVTLWADRDDAFFHVAQAIRDAVRRINEQPQPVGNARPTARPTSHPMPADGGGSQPKTRIKVPRISGTANVSFTKAPPRTKLPADSVTPKQNLDSTHTELSPPRKPERQVNAKALMESVRYVKSDNSVVFSAEIDKTFFQVRVWIYDIDWFLNKPMNHLNPADYISFVMARIDVLAARAGRKFLENPVNRGVFLSKDDMGEA